jgi:predicted GNAT family N-acyltransferase
MNALEIVVVENPADPTVVEAIRALRHDVFIVEQGVPEAIEQDGRDDSALHLLARCQGDAVGTLRLLFHDHARASIGRVAVVPSCRRRGIARALMERIHEEARTRGIAVLALHAQAPVVAFYERLGYRVIGSEFIEARIVHLPMELNL